MASEDDIRECRAVEDFEGVDADDVFENYPRRAQMYVHDDDGGDDDNDGVDDDDDDDVVEYDGGEMVESLIGRAGGNGGNDLIEHYLQRPCIGGDVRLIGNSGERELGVCGGGVNVDLHEGMEFESEEAAKAFYNSYARRVGFSVRVSIYSRSKRDGLIISRRFVCSKEGFRRKRNAGVPNGEGNCKRHRAVNQEGCKAMIVVKKQGPGKWVLSKFVEAHSHPLAHLGKVNSLRSHRGDKDKIIRELSHELELANQKSDYYRSQLLTILKSIEGQLSKKVEGIRQRISEIESEDQGSYLK